MKKNMHNLNKLSLLLLLAIVVFSLNAQDARREFAQSYDVREGVTLSMDTRYSDVEILAWEDNVVDILVEVEVEAPSDSRAREILEEARVEINRSGNTITVETGWSEGSGKDVKKELHVTVRAPSYLNVDIENSYGDLFVQEISGLALLDLKYSNLKAGRLSRGDQEPYNRIEFAYSNGTIDEAGWIELEIAYSDMEINSSERLFVESKYAKLNGAKAGRIETEGTYDKYTFDEIGSFAAELKYSGLKFGVLTRSLELESSYANVLIQNLSGEFESVDASLSYGNITMDVDNGTAFRLEGESKYGKIRVGPEGNLNRMKDGPTVKVSGTVGSNPRATINVTTKYGNIDIR
ncbi:MAG: DUF4097 family beta strand repeat-containing protein [Bacteroidales bacterium]